MFHRIPRSVRWALLIGVLGAITVTVVQSWTAAAPGSFGWTQTQWGPVGPADRDLLVKVRQAGLWELPTGQQAEQQAVNPQVKQVGNHIATEHAQLDEQVRKIADQLGIALPTRATDQQIAWMNEISAQTGTDYDRRFIQLLRQAHGSVLPVISEVRSGTRNELMRQFAATADEFVSRHLDYLEATGLVDYAALPQPPSPGLLSGGTTMSDLVVPAIVFIATAAAGLGLLMTLRRGRNAKNGGRRDNAGPATGPQLAALHTGPVAPTDPDRPRRSRRGSPTRTIQPAGVVPPPASHRRNEPRTDADPAGSDFSTRHSGVSRTGRNKAHNPDARTAGSGRASHRSPTREMTS